MILKAKVYIKNPAEAPQGAKVGRGARGGLYYESTEREHFTEEVSQIEQKIKETMKFTPEEEHIADNLIKVYTPVANREFRKVRSVIDGQISYRVKNKYSILEKTKRKGITANQLRDIFGMRIEVNNVDDVYESVKKLQSIYGNKIIRQEDAIKTPRGLYRSYHIDVQHAPGIYSEIQIRTPLMDKIANASHILLYKNTKELNPQIKQNIEDTLMIYSNIAVNQARPEDLHELPETQKLLSEFGLK